MSKKNPKPETETADDQPSQPVKGLNPEVVRAVCTLKADERKEVHAELVRADEAYQEARTTVNKKYAELVGARYQAEADAAAHAAYKEHLEESEYAREERRLKRAIDAARKAEDKHAEEGRKTLQKLDRPRTDLLRKAEDLTRQWRFHEKRAKEAGLDLSEFWMPPEPAALPSFEEA